MVVEMSVKYAPQPLQKSSSEYDWHHGKQHPYNEELIVLPGQSTIAVCRRLDPLDHFGLSLLMTVYSLALGRHELEFSHVIRVILP